MTSRYGLACEEDAVKRASDQITDIFARELYHEVIKLIAPIANSAERLKSKLADPGGRDGHLALEAEGIERRVAHLKAVLDSMRAYTAPANSRFAVEDVVEAVTEALGIAQEGRSDALLPRLICGDGPHHAEVCRPRLVQALTNVLVNAAEAYDGIGDPKPVYVSVAGAEGRVDITIEDFGWRNERRIARGTRSCSSRRTNQGEPASVYLSRSRSSSLNTLVASQSRVRRGGGQ